MEHQEQIQAFIAESKRKEELLLLRAILTDFPFLENIKWGMPNYHLDGKNLIGLGSFSHWSCLWLHQGVFLKDRAGVLENAQEGKTNGMRQWRFRSVADINEKRIREYLQETIENHQAGKEIKQAKPTKKQLEIPVIFATFLQSNVLEAKHFRAMSVSKRNAFIQYILDAKRESTKLSRLDKIANLLKLNRTLDDLWRKDVGNGDKKR